MAFEKEIQRGKFSNDFMESIEAFLEAGNLTQRRNVDIYNRFQKFRYQMYVSHDRRKGGSILEKTRFTERYVNQFESAKYHAAQDLNQRAADILTKKSLIQDFRGYRHRYGKKLFPSFYNHSITPGAALASWVGKGISSSAKKAIEVLKQVTDSETRREAGYKIGSAGVRLGTNFLFALPLQAMGVGYLLRAIVTNLNDLAETEQQKRFAKTIENDIEKLGKQPEDAKLNELIEKYFSTTVIRTLFANTLELRKHIGDLQPWLAEEREPSPEATNCNYVFDALYAAEYMTGLYNDLQNKISLMLAVSKVFLEYIQASTTSVNTALNKSAKELKVLSASVRIGQKNCRGCPRGRTHLLQGSEIPREKCCLLRNKSPERLEHAQNLMDMVETYFVDVDTIGPDTPRPVTEIEATPYSSFHKQSAALLPSYEPPKMGWRLRRKLGIRYTPKTPVYINPKAFNIPTLNYPKRKPPQFINPAAIFGSADPNAADVSNFSPGLNENDEYADVAEGWTDDGTTASGRD